MTAEQRRRLDEVKRVVSQINLQMRQPSSLQMTSEQLKQQADRRRDIAGQVQSAGGKVRPEYQ